MVSQRLWGYLIPPYKLGAKISILVKIEKILYCNEISINIKSFIIHNI
jgi:hypothetical protein